MRDWVAAHFIRRKKAKRISVINNFEDIYFNQKPKTRGQNRITVTWCFHLFDCSPICFKVTNNFKVTILPCSVHVCQHEALPQSTPRRAAFVLKQCSSSALFPGPTLFSSCRNQSWRRTSTRNTRVAAFYQRRFFCAPGKAPRVAIHHLEFPNGATDTTLIVWLVSAFCWPQ